MFTVTTNKAKKASCVILENTKTNTKAKVCLEEGGRIKDLIINNKVLIKELSTFNYSDSYAASILFPFANRIENGRYTFLNNTYQLEKNNANTNALHGLVYNKTFALENVVASSNFASIALNYSETKHHKGFPFTYNITLKYTLTDTYIDVLIIVKNTSPKKMPFTIGWHPYFYTKNLDNSLLKFKSKQAIAFDDNLITKHIVPTSINGSFPLKNKELDHCYILEDNTVNFITPDYHIEINTNQAENYLQLYTPKNQPLIAIEPMTGVSNSFNNKIGLQTIAPNNTYSTRFTVSLKQ